MNFTLPPELEAHEPPEARGLARDGVRLLVTRPGSLAHQRFLDLPELLEPGDVLVVNTSGTMPAAVDVIGHELTLHVSTELDDGRWIVEPRPRTDLRCLELKGGARVTLLEPYTDRLWIASFDVDSVPGYLRDHGRPIRYSYVEHEWPIEFYQTVFARQTGSATMPSAGRPFTEALVTRLVSQGVVIAPITLHTGVASPEADEKPYPEWFSVPATTARLVNEAHLAGRRVIAVGTTAVRALESAAALSNGSGGTVAAREGWTDLIITPSRGVHAVDGLLTGFHEPRASHLLMLEAIAGPELLEASYREAIAAGYLWHEFGDLNLILDR